MLTHRTIHRLSRPALLPLFTRRAASFQSYRLNTSSLDPATLSPADAKKFATEKIHDADRQSASPPKFSQQPVIPQYRRSTLPKTPAPTSMTDVTDVPEQPAAPVKASSQPAVKEEPPVETSATPAKTLTPAPPKRKSRLRAPRKAAISLTSAAVEQLRSLLDQPEPKLIRVGVKNRGCSGLSYHLEYVDKPAAFDEKVEQDGVMVLIDSKALFSIIGSEMDWVEDNMIEKFVFKNPNIKDQCGCGESFSV